MNEEELSVLLFRKARTDNDVELISWQGVDGKSYFTADVKLRLPDDRRMEPDLIVRVGAVVWLIELKALHSQALEDESKLNDLSANLSDDAIIQQIAFRARLTLQGCSLVRAVGFAVNDLGNDSACDPTVVHLCWDDLSPQVEEVGLGEVLRRLSLA